MRPVLRGCMVKGTLNIGNRERSLWGTWAHPTVIVTKGASPYRVTEVRHGGPPYILITRGILMSNLKPIKTRRRTLSASSGGQFVVTDKTYLMVQSFVKDVAVKRNPFIVGKSISNVIGKNLEMRSIRSGDHYLVTCENRVQANRLIKLEKLIDGTEVRVTMHRSLNTAKCVIFAPELMEMKEEEITKELEGQRVLETKRIMKRVGEGSQATPLLILSVDGTSIPDSINCEGMRYKTKQYYPNPMICFGCFKYGHTKIRCKDPQKCMKCSGDHKPEGCKNDPHCSNCDGDHSPTNRACPVYKREIEILKIKVNKGITFAEAKKLHAQSIKADTSYAQATKLSTRLVASKESDAKNRSEATLLAHEKQIKELKAVVEAQLLKIKALQEQLSSKTPSEAPKPQRVTPEAPKPQRSTQVSPLSETPGGKRKPDLSLKSVDSGESSSGGSKALEREISSLIEPKRKRKPKKSKKDRQKEASQASRDDTIELRVNDKTEEIIHLDGD